MWRQNDPQGGETHKVKHDIVRFTRGKGLDVGCGNAKGFKHWIGVDNLHHAHEFGWDIRPDVVSEADDLSMFSDESMDFVYSSHVLEHVEEPAKALSEWWRLIKVGGYLVVYLPHKDLYPNIGQPGANIDHKSDFLPKHITGIMKAHRSWDLVVDELRDYDHGEGSHLNEYSFLQVYQKTNTNKHYYTARNAPTKKKACVVRYGGFGDMIQAASVFPELHKQGYHVTVMTTPKGVDILKSDPNIDALEIQDTDQVPNEELTPFWNSRKKYFDRWVNLSESVEGTLLTIPGRTVDEYPHELRHAICDVNYLERTHDIAEVPHKFHANFHATKLESEWVNEQRSAMGRIVIMWVLAGSSMHKISPYVDNVIARLMLVDHDVDVVLVGDNMCTILEGDSWNNEPRVHTRSGKWSIRESLAFAVHGADIVVGPETGVLNAVGLADTPKVIALSHSSEENLTKHWVNTTALMSKAKCYPCHKMHYGQGTCPYVELDQFEQDGETMKVVCPACTSDIDADKWYKAIDYWVEQVRAWQRQAVPISQ